MQQVPLTASLLDAAEPLIVVSDYRCVRSSLRQNSGNRRQRRPDVRIRHLSGGRICHVAQLAQVFRQQEFRCPGSNHSEYGQPLAAPVVGNAAGRKRGDDAAKRLKSARSNLCDAFLVRSSSLCDAVDKNTMTVSIVAPSSHITASR